MSHEFPFDTALQILRSAFTPLDCSVQSEDHGNAAHVRILRNSGQPLIDLGSLTKQQLTNARRLKFIITEARDSVEQQGAVLLLWQFPEAGQP